MRADSDALGQWEDWSIVSADHVFWMGDLNYRLNMPDGLVRFAMQVRRNRRLCISSSSDLLLRSSTLSQNNIPFAWQMPEMLSLLQGAYGHVVAEQARTLIQRGELEALADSDELSWSRRAGHFFFDWHENPLHFPPMYKFRCCFKVVFAQ